MKKSTFRNLENTKKRAILGAVLKKRTQGHLSDAQIRQVLIGLDINVQYTIEILNNPPEFAKAVTLRDHHDVMYESETKTVDAGRWLVGYGRFGIDKIHDTDPNSNMSDRYHEKSDFDPNQSQVAVIQVRHYEWRKGNGEHETTAHYILVFIPDGTPVIDEETLELCNRFGLLKK